MFVLKIDRPRKKNFLVKGLNKSAIKILFRKGLKNPLLKFYFERDYQIRHWAILAERGWQIRQKKARLKNGYHRRGQTSKYVAKMGNNTINDKKNSNKMFKFKSYNVKKASEKNEKQQPLSSTATAKATATATATTTATLKKPSSKEKKKPSPQEIKAVNNITSPVFSKKNTVTEWHKNKTYLAKNETKKVVIPSPHKKLERK